MNKSMSNQSGQRWIRRTGVWVLLLGMTLAVGCQSKPELGAWYEADESPREPSIEFLPHNIAYTYEHWGSDGIPGDVDVKRYRIEGDRLYITELFAEDPWQRTYIIRFTRRDTMVIQLTENNELQGSPDVYLRNHDFDLRQSPTEQ